MSVHSQVDELLAPHSMGMLDAREAALVESHLSGCADCTEAMARLREVAAAMAFATPSVQPPAELKAKLSSLLTTEAAGSPAPSRVAGEPRKPWVISLAARPRPMLWAPAAAAAALIAGLAFWNIGLNTQANQDRAQLAQLRGQVVSAQLLNSSHAAVGSVTYLSQDKVAFVTLHSLASAPSGKVYELWIMRKGLAPQPAGTFLPESDGSKLIVVNAAMKPSDQMGVTVEPPGGSPAPTSAPIVTGTI